MYPAMIVRWAGVALLAWSAFPSHAVELKVSREALQRTLKDQLFSGPNGRYYLKGSEQSPCSIYAEDPQLSFVQDRILVRVKTHARVGKAVHGTCIGLVLAPS